MALGGNNNSFMSDINVTPFVDVMLVLLIIFMVTAPMMIEGVNVSLPEATSEPLPAEQDQLIITIDKNNQIYINDYQVTLDFLREKLIKILDGRVGQEVYLKADKNISYGTVVRVMSEIKGAGIEKLGMVTEPITPNNNKGK
ncbi:MAG: protein TolR [Proteobacteria bacterium]|nr:protein TolR [Desulfobacteraceae bacterium]MBU3980822.1 protein TolR [Pseudomonadota bacterium]MBU4013972.1 protein TolR [Pseudomonadota bacterium]MBU4067654.1 protein TolR [Pseudomonadota bacterium]MBU4100154.1 protein TolR [Pseudomonadota bacterium]